MPDEAALDFDENANQPPPITVVGAWYKVRDDNLIPKLEEVAEIGNWVLIEGENALVTYDSRDIVTPEPRFQQHLLPRRSVYARFPEHLHEHGMWYQLQDNVESDTRHNIGYRVPT